MSTVGPIRIFLDDERNHPIGEDWIIVRTVEDLLHLVDTRPGDVVEISFDNDLMRPLEGIHGLTAIRERILDQPGLLGSLERVTVHSANGVAAEAMIFDLLAYRRVGIMPDIEIRRRPANEDLYPLADEDVRTGIVVHTMPAEGRGHSSPPESTP